MTQTSQQALAAQLMETNDDYRRLAQQHLTYKHRIEELGARRFPTLEEQVEERRLKKLKLSLKDKMHDILKQSEQQAL